MKGLVPNVPVVPSTSSTTGTSQHRYKLEAGSKKHYCPNCCKKRFVRYVDVESGQYLPEQYGRCDRESKCGYHLNPYNDGYAKMIWQEENGQQNNWKPNQAPKPKSIAPTKEPVFIPYNVLKQTLTGYEKNVFIQNLLSRVDYPIEKQDVERVIALYYLGTVQNGYRTGAVTFPFIDTNGNIRAIQVKQFDETNHTTSTDFLHSVIEKYHIGKQKPLPQWLEDYKGNDSKVSCLFGEHLLDRFPNNPVALVEAPKTAIYGTLYFGFPDQSSDIIWLAVYNLSSLHVARCKVLKGRDVFLFPDLSKDGNAFELWSHKAKEVKTHLPGTYIVVSDLLERLAPHNDKEQGKDLADYLIQQDWRLYRKQTLSQAEKQNNTIVVEISEGDTNLSDAVTIEADDFDAEFVEQPAKKQPQDWTAEIQELESYFAGVTLPKEAIRLNQCCTISNINLFLEGHFATIRANNDTPVYQAYLQRLHDLKQKLTLQVT